MRIVLRLTVLLVIISAIVVYWAFGRQNRDEELKKAVRQGDLQSVRELLARGASPRRPPRGTPPLSLAIQQGNTEIALALIDAGGADDPQIYMYSALIKKDERVVEQLIRRGADLNRSCNVHGHTPLLVAASKSNEKMVSLLLRNGAKIDQRCDAPRFEGETALTRGVASRNVPVVKLLLEKGADPNVIYGHFDSTPIMSAAAAADVESVKLLLDHGADPNAIDKNGWTALRSAATALKHGNREPEPGMRQRGWRPRDPAKLKKVIALLKRAGARAPGVSRTSAPIRRA